MKPRNKRLVLVGGSLASLGLAVWLVLSAFSENLVFFFTPSQIAAGKAASGSPLRIGGMVEPGSVRKMPDGLTVRFLVTDTVQRLPVEYKGILPDLFRESRGVVAQGRLGTDGVFRASEVLAKHDENYMPPEAAYAMKNARKEGQ
jgi:cytochrome c-type biogenesis protein CcmE